MAPLPLPLKLSGAGSFSLWCSTRCHAKVSRAKLPCPMPPPYKPVRHIDVPLAHSSSFRQDPCNPSYYVPVIMHRHRVCPRLTRRPSVLASLFLVSLSVAYGELSKPKIYINITGDEGRGQVIFEVPVPLIRW